MYKGAFSLIPEFSFLYPMVKNEITGDSVPFSEGVMESTGVLNAQIDFKTFKLTGFAGFNYRDQGRSSLFPYGAVAELNFIKWSLGADLKGYASLGFDKDTDNDTARLAYVARTSGGANRYTSVNPNYLELNSWLKIRTSNRWAFKLGGGTTLNGASTAAGWNIAAGISFNMVPQNESTPGSDIERFHEETNDGVDQKLFVPEDSVKKPEPVKESETGSIEYYPPAQEPAKKPKKKTKPAASTKNIQQQLDETEVQIQLKSVKKKKYKGD
jgi:hypothetical protein